MSSPSVSFDGFVAAARVNVMRAALFASSGSGSRPLTLTVCAISPYAVGCTSATIVSTTRLLRRERATSVRAERAGDLARAGADRVVVFRA